MDSFEVIVSPKALSQLDSYIDYVQYTLLYAQATEQVWQDAVKTVERLEKAAGSLPFCAHPKLRELGYRFILFNRHRYIMLYRLQGHCAYVEAVYHLQQDYQNLFLDSL